MQMTQEARNYLETVDKVSSGALEQAIGIGRPFAERLIDQFQAEGLISRPDRTYKHNVRSASGELIEPPTTPRATWEDYALNGLHWIARMRGRDV